MYEWSDRREGVGDFDSNLCDQVGGRGQDFDSCLSGQMEGRGQGILTGV